MSDEIQSEAVLFRIYDQHLTNYRPIIGESSFDSQDQWYVTQNSIRSAFDKFFQVKLFDIDISGRENGSWVQPLIVEKFDPNGQIGLIFRVKDRAVQVLVQFKIEPGNPDIYQLSPTIQATRSNFLRFHGGSLPPFFDSFYSLGEQKWTGILSEDGGRFFKKTNEVEIRQVEASAKVELPNLFYWVESLLLKKVIAKGGRRVSIINPHLRDTLLILDSIDWENE